MRSEFGLHQDALLLSPARAAIAEKDRRVPSVVASPMISDSEAGIVDGMNDNDDGMMEFTKIFLSLSGKVVISQNRISVC